MGFSYAKTALLVAGILSLLATSVGCSPVSNVAMGLENDVEATTTQATTTTAATTVTTEREHYDLTLTVPMYQTNASTSTYSETSILQTSPSVTTTSTLSTTDSDGKPTYTTYDTTVPTYTVTDVDTSQTTDGTYTTTEDTTTDSSTYPIASAFDTSMATTQGEYIPVDTATTEADTPSTVDSSYLFNGCAFIGDSLTVGLSTYGYIPEDYTFAQTGISLLKINSLQLSTTCGYVYPAQAVAGWQSKHVYILLGINGVTWVSDDTAIARYTQLITDILTYSSTVEDINVISVLPVAYSMEAKSSVESGRILNSEVDAFNLKLQAMANELGVNYIDVNSSLKDQYGRLPDELTVDGLHLTQAGYERFRDALLASVQ
jgi:hypothetical protein